MALARQQEENALSSSEARTVAFMDIGTNSIRLLLVRFHPNHAYTTLLQLKQIVRLGEGEFTHRHLQPPAMARAVLVARQFAGLARAHGADEIIAVATAATREADNQDVFLARLQDEAQLDVRVVSGPEEARLIYLHAGTRHTGYPGQRTRPARGAAGGLPAQGGQGAVAPASTRSTFGGRKARNTIRPGCGFPSNQATPPRLKANALPSDWPVSSQCNNSPSQG